MKEMGRVYHDGHVSTVESGVARAIVRRMSLPETRQLRHALVTFAVPVTFMMMRRTPSANPERTLSGY